MKREHATDNEVLTNLGKDRLVMGVDEDGIVQVCDLLTGQYTDEELAVLREYVCNAWDSHVEAVAQAVREGRTPPPVRPVEVTLPISHYELATEDKGHFLKIKDYGTGLSIEEIATVYSRYGKSTKDHSDEQVGGFGIGGKVGLVPTFGSFIITAVKDGEKAVVHVGRDEGGAPVMDLTSATKTDEPNGVEIFLPVERRHNLRRKAEALFQFWPEGSVLVDGQAPERLKPKIELSPSMWICDGLYSKNQRTDFIVMGNVPYPVQLDGKLADGHSLVFFVPIGTVMPAPSREALRMTPKTKDAIARLMAEYDQIVKTTIQSKVDAAPTKAAAVKEAMKWRSSFMSKADLDVTYKGQKMPMRFKAEQMSTTEGLKKGIVVAEKKSNKPSHHSRQEEIFVGTLVDAVLVHGYSQNFVANHRQKLDQWAREKGLSPKHYVLTEKRLAHGWIDSSMRVDWETIKAIRLATVSRYGVKGTRPKGSYPMYLAGSWSSGVEADQIPLDQPIFWCEPDWLDDDTYSYRRGRLTKKLAVFAAFPTATIVELTGNRVNKFKRDFPQAKHVRETLEVVYQNFLPEVTKAKLKRFALEDEYSVVAELKRLDLNKVDDPKVKAVIRLAHKPCDDALRLKVADIKRICRKPADPALTFKWENPMNAYPLADTRSERNREHTYLYMNAVFAAQEKK